MDEAQCLENSKEPVKDNDLVWSEGFLRGYLELEIYQEEMHADYYGVDV
jgi:alkaline phosphatase D